MVVSGYGAAASAGAAAAAAQNGHGAKGEMLFVVLRL